MDSHPRVKKLDSPDNSHKSRVRRARPTCQASSLPLLGPSLDRFPSSMVLFPHATSRPSPGPASLAGRATVTTETLGPTDGALGSLGSRAPLTTLSPVSGTGTVFTTRSTPAVCRGKPRTRASEGPKGRVTGGQDQQPVVSTHRLGGTAPAAVFAS